MPRLLILLLPLLLAACATTQDASKMTEAQRIRAAGKGNIDAIVTLQWHEYRDENGVLHPRSREDQYKWLRKAAEMGSNASQARLAYLSLYGDAKANANGPLVPHDPAEALRLAQAAVVPRECLYKYDCMTPGYDMENTRKLATKAETILRLQPLADKGDAAAMYELSQAYVPPEYNGETSKLPPSHWQWMRRAAEAGNLPALRRMAAEEGEVWKERLTAKEVAAGTPEVLYEMGKQAHARGDEKAALEWYRKAAARGSVGARSDVARLTDATALRLKAAATAGDTEAMFQLAEYFRAGKWIGTDQDEARAWYEAAAKGGHAGAIAWLAAERGQRTAEERRQQEEADRRVAAEQQRADETRREAEARYQQQQAFVARIDREGSTDFTTVEQYCKFGGRRCDELRVTVRRALEQQNRNADAANMRRLQQVYSTDKRTQEQRDADFRDRSDCMQKKTEAQERYNRGQQDWYFKGDC